MERISEVAGHIRQADGACFIIGAGASRSAGIPTATELVKRVNDDFAHCLTGLPDEDKSNYGKVMYRLSPAERERLISPLLENSRINWGQIALAALAADRKVNRILTFNFDLVLERAAALLGLQLPIYDFGGAPTADINRIARSAILHLHGQSYGLVLLNSNEETQRHKTLLRPLLSDTVRNHLTIVIGYSGEADGALEVIQQEFNSHHRLIWLGHGESQPEHLRPLIDQPYADYIGGCDFDLTMISLARELGIWPPAIVQNPMRHLLDELSDVTDYPTQKETDIDVLSHMRFRLLSGAEHWDKNNSPDDVAVSNIFREVPKSEEIDLLVPQADKMSEIGNRALGWSLLRIGNALASEAETQSGEQAEAKFKLAGEKYAAALK